MRIWLVSGWLGLGWVGLGGGNAVPAQDDFVALFDRAQAIDAAQAEGRRQAFLAAYRAFARLDPQSAAYRQVLARGAVAAAQAGLAAAAIELLDEQWQLAGGSDPLLRQRLSAMSSGGRMAAAIELAYRHRVVFAAAVAAWMAQTGFGALMGAADEMLWAGQTAPGLWVFEQLAAAYATSPGVIANLALVLRRLGRLAKAEATYRRALELAPDDAVVRSDLGLLLKGRGDHEAAAAAFLTALRCEGPAGTSPAGTNLGVLFQRTGKRRGRDPEADLVAVLRLRPQQSLARRLLLDGLTARARSGR